MPRDFNLGEDEMLELTAEHRTHFLTYKADFVAEDADFADPFAADWLTSIEASEDVVDAETRDDQLTGKTADVLEQMALGKQVYGEMKYFVNKAYPDNKPVQNEFGFNDYDGKSDKQPKMIRFLKKLYNTANSATYKPALLAASCTQPKIDDVKAIHDALFAANNSQNAFNHSSGVDTDARDTQYNETWAFSKKVNACAHIIYRNAPSKLSLFLFPVSAGVDPFTLTGTVTDSVTLLPIQGIEVKILEAGLTLNTDALGQYGAVLPDGDYSVGFGNLDYTTQSFNITIAGGVAVTQDAVMVHV